MPRRERVEGPFGAEMPIVVPFCASPSDRRACRSFCRLQCPPRCASDRLLPDKQLDARL